MAKILRVPGSYRSQRETHFPDIAVIKLFRGRSHSTSEFGLIDYSGWNTHTSLSFIRWPIRGLLTQPPSRNLCPELVSAEQPVHQVASGLASLGQIVIDQFRPRVRSGTSQGLKVTIRPPLLGNEGKIRETTQPQSIAVLSRARRFHRRKSSSSSEPARNAHAGTSCAKHITVVV
jgi:hypothetical protein